MRILITEMYGNGVHLARQLAERCAEGDLVMLASESVPSDIHETEMLKLLPVDLSVDEMVAIARRNRIELFLNHNTLVGVTGIVEAMASAGIRAIGSNRALSETEIDKRGFKRWLRSRGFNTPAILFNGKYDNVLAKAAEFHYPLVIKPDRQVGPKVSVCRSETDLTGYLERVAAALPYAKFAVDFLIEEHIPIAEHIHVGFFICGGRAHLSALVRMPRDSAGAREAGECLCVLMHVPRAEGVWAEAARCASELAAIGTPAFTSLQCALTPDGALYVLESNARPGSHSATGGSFGDPLKILECLAADDAESLSRQLIEQQQRVVLGIGLLHADNEITVDVERLASLEGFEFVPNSIVRRGDRYISRIGNVASVLNAEGTDGQELLSRLERGLPHIASAGAFLKIRPEQVKQMLAT